MQTSLESENAKFKPALHDLKLTLRDILSMAEEIDKLILSSFFSLLRKDTTYPQERYMQLLSFFSYREKLLIFFKLIWAILKKIPFFLYG